MNHESSTAENKGSFTSCPSLCEPPKFFQLKQTALLSRCPAPALDKGYKAPNIILKSKPLKVLPTFWTMFRQTIYHDPRRLEILYCPISCDCPIQKASLPLPIEIPRFRGVHRRFCPDNDGRNGHHVLTQINSSGKPGIPP